MTNVRYVLEQCLGHFQSYEARHLAKGTEEDNARAASGREFITLCQAALDEVHDLETRGGIPKREAIEMMQRCVEEITMLRKRIEELTPKERVA